MECPLCGHEKTHKHGKMPNGHQRFLCPSCHQTFSEKFDTLYYHRHLPPERIDQVLQAHREGVSLRGISRITGVAYNTVVSIIRAASTKALLVHNSQVREVTTDEVSGDEMWSFVKKTETMLARRN
jgi:transposase-like protein